MALERTTIVSHEVRQLLHLPWTMVFTSCIDGLTRDLLTLPNRRAVHQVTAGDARPSGTSDLLLFRLFGTVERKTADELPPSDSAALRRRRQAANDMLQLLTEVAAAEGAVLIEGWSPREDWLRVRELSMALAALDSERVLLCGIEDLSALEDDEDFRELISLGIVKTTTSRLSDLVHTLESAGELADVRWPGRERTPEYEVADSVPFLEGEKTPLRRIEFDASTWKRLNETMSILQPLDVAQQLPPALEEQRRLFRELLAHGPTVALDPYLSQLAFRRPEYDHVLRRCFALAHDAAAQDHVFLLYGQSGCGKTTILRLLALELRSRGFPVVYSRRSLIPLNQNDLDRFCEAVSADSSGPLSLPVFFVYDATLEDAEYLSIASFLSGRNRKCIVIGSAYPSQLLSPKKRTRRGVVIDALHISAQVASQVAEDFVAHFSRFTGLARQPLVTLLGADLTNFFASVYRLSPEARPQLAAQLVEEIDKGSERIQREIEHYRDKEPPGGSPLLAIKLRAALGAKLQEAVDKSFAQIGDKAGTSRIAEAILLLNAVMLVSRLGLLVPQSLALRLIHNDIPVYRGTTDGDVIDEVEVAPQVYALKARHPLEADIWIMRRLPSLDDQFAIIRSLCLQLRSSEIVGHSLELEFAVKALQQLGPEGKHAAPSKFGVLANVVRELRERHGAVSPRLLFLESHALREHIRESQRLSESRAESSEERLDDWVSQLDRADDGLLTAMDLVLEEAPDGGKLSEGRRHMLASLSTERANVLGYKLGSVLRACKADQYASYSVDIDRWFAQARHAWRQSLRYDDDNYQTLGSAAWILEERLRFPADPVNEAELLVEWAEIIDRYQELELPPSQLDRRDRAEAKFAERCGDSSRFDTVLQRAEARGSYAVHALKARRLSKGTPSTAREFLEDECGHVLLTNRDVLLVYMRLWWRTETGLESFFESERLCLPFTREQWTRLSEIAASRLRLEGEEQNPVALFWHAVAELHLGHVESSVKTFDHINRLGIGGFRRLRALVLLSDERGKPRTLTGEYHGRRQGGSLLAWCDELRTNVRFFEREQGIEPRPGTRLPPFHVALGFRGMVAERPQRYRDKGHGHAAE